MNKKRTFSVAAIGLSENERKVLRNIFRLSLYRPRSFSLLDGGIDAGREILLVDPDGRNALSDWRAFRDRFPETPTVIVTNDAPSKTRPYCTRRPFVATRVLTVFDQVAIKEFNFAPEIMIGAEEANYNNNHDVINHTVSATAPARVDAARHIALVVDDSQAVRKQMELELKLFNIAADYAETGEQAFELLNNKTYDVVFLDVVLPGVDGYRVCRTIKKDKRRRKTPVIMLTGKSSPFDRIKGRFAGCDTYLTKPVAHESFRKVIRKYFN